MVELLAGPLVGAAVADKLGARNWGNLVLAIDPAAVSDDGDTFRCNATALLARVRDATPLPGSTGPALPGQRSDALAGAWTPADGCRPMPCLIASRSWHCSACSSAGCSAEVDRVYYGPPLATLLSPSHEHANALVCRANGRTCCMCQMHVRGRGAWISMWPCSGNCSG